MTEVCYVCIVKLLDSIVVIDVKESDFHPAHDTTESSFYSMTTIRYVAIDVDRAHVIWKFVQVILISMDYVLILAWQCFIYDADLQAELQESE